MRGTRWSKPWGLLALGAALVALAGGPARAADDKVVEDLKATLEAVKARLERLEKQNEELKRARQPPATPEAPGGEPSPEKLNKMVDSYLEKREEKKKVEDKEKEEKKKAEDKLKAEQKEAEGYKVGSETDTKSRWNLDQGLMFEPFYGLFRQ